MSAKNKLQEYFQKKRLDLPKYHTASARRGAEQTFLATVRLADGRTFTGRERSRRVLAEQSAAQVALDTISKTSIISRAQEQQTASAQAPPQRHPPQQQQSQQQQSQPPLYFPPYQVPAYYTRVVLIDLDFAQSATPPPLACAWVLGFARAHVVKQRDILASVLQLTVVEDRRKNAAAHRMLIDGGMITMALFAQSNGAQPAVAFEVVAKPNYSSALCDAIRARGFPCRAHDDYSTIPIKV